MKFHQEGMPFIIGACLFALLGFILKPQIGLILAPIAGFMFYFFRDPERVMPEKIDNIILSPADGKIVDIAKDTYNGKTVTRISIFLNVDDVHINRIPISGKVKNRIYRKGGFAHAASDKALENESLTLEIEGKVTVAVRQVAGFLARRIVCYPDTNDNVVIGNRYGLIKFSSRVDLFLPENIKLAVLPKQTVVGGETVLAHIS